MDRAPVLLGLEDMPEPPLARAYALICPDTSAGICFISAPWPGLPEQMMVESRKRRGAWGRNGVVSQARARELWLQHRQKCWEPRES